MSRMKEGYPETSYFTIHMMLLQKVFFECVRLLNLTELIVVVLCNETCYSSKIIIFNNTF